ncbi:MAG: hypothetical protein N2255_01980, partial [Kiritimatiellae bacterium]|nr:hypothetical protein [Kiritimatiellia bacterium]
MKESGRRRFIAALSVIFVASGQAQGGTWTWCGAGSDNRWSTEANWAETGRPTSHYTTRLIFAGWMRLTPDQDIEETFLFNSLVFSTNAGPFQFDGTVVYSGLPGLRNYKFAGSSPSLAVLGTNNVLIKGALITRDEQCDH